MQLNPQELTTLKGQVTKLENQAQSVTIETKQDYEGAIDLVSKLKDTASQIKEKKEAITKPLNESLKHVRSLFVPIEDQFEKAEKIIKTKLLDYKKKKDEEARIEEEKIANRAEKGTIKLETAERKMSEIERVDNTTSGKVGQIQVKKIKKVRIVNADMLPREYLVPDEVRIRKDALSGIVIPGAEVYEEETIAAR